MTRPAPKRGVYKVGTIARLTGFSPSLLRAWESRFSILDPARAAKGHRLYTEDDLTVLRRVKALVTEGRSIGEIVLAGRQGLLAQATGGATLAPVASAPVAAPPITARRAAASPERPAPEAGLGRHVARIVEGAVELDGERIVDALDAAFSHLSPEVAIEGVLVPAAREIGTLWAEGVVSIAGEHLASGLFTQRIQKLLDAVNPASRNGPAAICACLPDEPHDLGCLILAHHLARAGWRVTLLGASLPLDELEAACDRLLPQIVGLSVTREGVLAKHLERLLELARRRSDRCTFWVGGCGVAGFTAALEAAGAHVWPPGRSLAEFSVAPARARGSRAPSRPR